MDALADRMLSDNPYSLHDFRRTVATNLHSNGVVGETIDHILGWAPVSIRQRYYHVVQPEDAHAAILQLYADEPL